MRVPALASAALILLWLCSARRRLSTPTSTIKPGPTGWQFQFTPYGWLPWVEGDAVIRGREFEVSENPVQVLESLDFAWMSYMQARRGAMTLFSDIIYADVSNSDSLRDVENVLAARRAARSVPRCLPTTAIGSSKRAPCTRPTAGKLGQHSAAETDTWLELLAGGRYWHQELDVNVALAGTLNVDGLIVSGTTRAGALGRRRLDRSVHRARLHYKPHRGEEFILRGDIGGFGIGSQFTWHVLATY